MGIAPFLVVSGFILGVLERASARDSPPLGRLLGQEGAGSILGARRDGEGGVSFLLGWARAGCQWLLMAPFSVGRCRSPGWSGTCPTTAGPSR